MAIQTEPTRIQIPFADSGTKNVIPDTNSTPSASQAASWTDGFPAQCSLPLSAGGIPPARADFNGIFNTMTQSLRYGQEGGVWAWDATVDYAANRVVLGSDGLLYWSVAQSGPNVGGAQDPTLDTAQAYWTAFNVPTVSNSDSSKKAVNSEWVNSWYTNKILPTDFYADPVNGNDSNDGTTASSPKKTVAAIHNIINTTKFAKPNDINIHLAAGDYGEILYANTIGSMVNYIGPSSGEATFKNFEASAVASTSTIKGRFKLNYHGLYVARGASVTIANNAYIDFDNITNLTSIYVYINGTLATFSGTTATFAFTGTNTFSSATIRTATGGKAVFAGTINVSGSATGKRYQCAEGSGISGTGSTTKFPGTTNGTTDSTSFYN